MKDQAITARKNMSQREGLSQFFRARVRGWASGSVVAVADPITLLSAGRGSLFRGRYETINLFDLRAGVAGVPAESSAAASEGIPDARRSRECRSGGANGDGEERED